MDRGQQFPSGPLYHGTWASWLRKGQLIVPNFAAIRNFNISSYNHVYTTEDPEEAKWYAEVAHKNFVNKLLPQMNPNEQIEFGTASPTVYEVSPVGLVLPDSNRDNVNTTTWQSPKAKVIRKLTEGIGSEWE